MGKATKHILIVGGYGHVGKLIARELLAKPNLGVRLAGRNREKAETAAAALGCSFAVLDIAKSETWEPAVVESDVIVMCIDTPDNSFAAHVLMKGKLYVDISANQAVIESVESLDSLACSFGGSAIVSVGFAPGLTNLMVKSAAARMDRAEKARIGVLLGLGDAHGEAAILWTLSNASDPKMPDRTPAHIRFGDDRKASVAYPFPFSDQYAVRRTLGLSDANTFLSVGHDFFTTLAFRGAPLLRDRPGAQRALAALLTQLRVGSDRAALAVEVFGRLGPRLASVTMTCEGRREAEITARVAAFVVCRLLDTEAAPGVHHIDEIIDPEAVFDELAASGVAIAVR
jgi:saccharopine dehydrogenase (NAD+, L-lysine forming)